MVHLHYIVKKTILFSLFISLFLLILTDVKLEICALLTTDEYKGLCDPCQSVSDSGDLVVLGRNWPFINRELNYYKEFYWFCSSSWCVCSQLDIWFIR